MDKLTKGFDDGEWPTWSDSRLIRDLEPNYQMVIVPKKDYRIGIVFWRGGNRLDDYARPSYEVII